MKQINRGRRQKGITLFVLLSVLFAGLCPLRGAERESRETSAYPDSYIKLYEWKELPSGNLQAVLKDDRHIMEIKAPQGREEVRFTVDVWRDGSRENLSTADMSISAEDLNYLSIRNETRDQLELALNGNKSGISLSRYFENATTLKTTFLDQERPLEKVTYLMYIEDGNEVLDLEQLYAGEQTFTGHKLLVVKMELL